MASEYTNYVNDINAGLSQAKAENNADLIAHFQKVLDIADQQGVAAARQYDESTW